MTMASGSRVRLSYGEEVTFGTVPAIAFTQISHNNATPNLKFDNFKSNRVDATRNILDFRHGMKKVDSAIGCEIAHGAHDDLWRFAMGSAWTADRLNIGTNLYTFCLEQAFMDLGKYRVFKGCAINEMEVEIKPDGICMVNFGIIGRDAAAFQGTSFSTGAVVVPTAGSVMDALTATITEGGSGIATITGVKFKLSNGRSTVGVVGTRLTPAIFEGTADVSGSFTALFDSETLYNKFVNETESNLVIRLNDVDGLAWLEFGMPRIKYGTGNFEPPREGPIPVTFEFQALYDDVEATALYIKRSA